MSRAAVMLVLQSEEAMARAREGSSFLEWAKAHPQFKTIPIVAITGDISERQATATLAQGASAVMKKEQISTS